MIEAPRRRGSRLLEVLTFGLLGGGSEAPAAAAVSGVPCRSGHARSSAADGSSGGTRNIRQRGGGEAYIPDEAHGSSSSGYGRTSVGRSGSTYKRGSLSTSSYVAGGQPSASSASSRAIRMEQQQHASAGHGLAAGSHGSIRFPPIAAQSSDSTRQQMQMQMQMHSSSSERDSSAGPGRSDSGSGSRRPLLERSHSHSHSYPASSRGNAASSSSSSLRGGESEKVRSSSSSSSSSSTALCCDKCDGKHATSACPHFAKSRDDHPDAQRNFYKKLGGSSSLPGNSIRVARIVRQPGDGSCLFHSMSYGLNGSDGNSLRAEICAFISRNPEFRICETPLSSWVKWDSGQTTTEYARRMSRGQWGGGIEMAVCSELKACNVHVYERSGVGYKRISAFDYHTQPEKRRVVRVVYQGGVHYDALVPSL